MLKPPHVIQSHQPAASTTDVERLLICEHRNSYTYALHTGVRATSPCVKLCPAASRRYARRDLLRVQRAVLPCEQASVCPHHGQLKPLADGRRGAMDDETFAWCLFQEADADESGALDREEIRALSRNLGCPLNEQELDAALQEMDEDGGGTVSFDEFYTWFQRAAGSKKGSWAAKMAEQAKEYMFSALTGRDTGQFSGGLATRMQRAKDRQASAVSAVGKSIVDIGGGVMGGLQTKTFSSIVANDVQPSAKYRSSPRFGRRSVSPCQRSIGLSLPLSQSPSAGRRRQSSEVSVGCVSSSASIDRRIVYVGALPTCAGPRARLCLDEFHAMAASRADPLRQPQRRGPVPRQGRLATQML